MNFDDFDDFDNDDELSFLMEQEQGDNISSPTQAGRTHPLPHDPNKHFAWGIYKSKKNNKGRRPTCRTESCYNKQFNHFEPPPPPPPPPAIMAYGGGKIKKQNRKKRNIKKRTRKNKYSSKKSQSNRIQKKTRKYK